MEGNILRDMMAIEMAGYKDIKVFVEHPDLLDVDWLWPMQKEMLYEFYNPARNYKELIVVAGMRSGKTAAVSIPACYEVFKMIMLGSPLKYYGLPKGSNVYILNVANSQRQALDTVFTQVKARIDNSPWFQNQTYKEHYNEFIFPVNDGKIIVRSTHSNSASLVGLTSKIVIFDEIARFVDTGGKSSGEMVYTSLSRSTKTFGKHAKLISISSPIFVDDYQMQLYRSAKQIMKKRGPTSPSLSYHLATWEMNPTITKDDLWEEFQKNPEAAWRDYGAMPSGALETYFKEPWRIEDCMKNDLENWEDVGVQAGSNFHYAAGDPAYKNDAFGFVILHVEDNGIYIVDLIKRFVPQLKEDRREVDAFEIRDYIVDKSKASGVRKFVTDTWQFPETIQSIQRAGIKVEQHHVKKEDYDFLKELIYTKRIKIPEHPGLFTELRSLEITRGIKVDHPRAGSKDMADALANACWLSRQHGMYEVPIMFSQRTW